LRKTYDKASADWVSSPREDNRDDLLCRENTYASSGNNDIDFLPDELGNDHGRALAASLRPSNLDREGPTLDPAEFAQPLHESGDALVLNRAFRRAREPNGRQPRRLLCARRERPRDRAAEQRNELAALHVGPCPFLPGVTT
jgi:hypothetical protein